MPVVYARLPAFCHLLCYIFCRILSFALSNLPSLSIVVIVDVDIVTLYLLSSADRCLVVDLCQFHLAFTCLPDLFELPVEFASRVASFYHVVELHIYLLNLVANLHIIYNFEFTISSSASCQICVIIYIIYSCQLPVALLPILSIYNFSCRTFIVSMPVVASRCQIYRC